MKWTSTKRGFQMSVIYVIFTSNNQDCIFWVPENPILSMKRIYIDSNLYTGYYTCRGIIEKSMRNFYRSIHTYIADITLRLKLSVTIPLNLVIHTCTCQIRNICQRTKSLRYF